jgi:hypothetical protein
MIRRFHRFAQIGSGGIAASKIRGCAITLMKTDKVDISAIQDHGGIRSWDLEEACAISRAYWRLFRANSKSGL